MLLCLCWAALAAEPSLPTQMLRMTRGDGTRVAFEVEVASNDEQRRTGLMGRTALPARHGMLFDFETPTVATMWMKDTPLSLDMLFIDAAGQVVGIAERTVPGALDLITAPRPVRFVLELNGGEARALGLAVGDRASLAGARQGLESGAETLERQ